MACSQGNADRGDNCVEIIIHCGSDDVYKSQAFSYALENLFFHILWGLSCLTNLLTIFYPKLRIGPWLQTHSHNVPSWLKHTLHDGSCQCIFDMIVYSSRKKYKSSIFVNKERWFSYTTRLVHFLQSKLSLIFLYYFCPLV